MEMAALWLALLEKSLPTWYFGSWIFALDEENDSTLQNASLRKWNEKNASEI